MGSSSSRHFLDYIGLIVATTTGDTEVVENKIGVLDELFEGINSLLLDGITGERQPILCYAIKAGQVAVVELLLLKNADPSLPGSDGIIPIVLATLVDSVEIIGCLNKSGADINVLTMPITTKQHGLQIQALSALHVASIGGLIPIIQYLFDNGADINILSSLGASPLCLAVFHLHIEAVRLLLQLGADCNSTDNDGESILHYSATVFGRSVFCAKYSSSSQSDSSVSDSLEILKLLTTVDNIRLDAQTKTGLTALAMMCADDEYMPGAKILVEAGSKLNACSNSEIPPLCLAGEAGSFKISEFLIQKSADLTAALWNGNTALHLACANGHESVLDIFAAFNPALVAALLGKKNVYGCTPLHLAALHGHLIIVKCLIEQSGDLNEQDNDGSTALHNAVDSGNTSLVEFVFNQPSVKLGLKNKSGMNAVAHAYRLVHFHKNVGGLTSDHLCACPFLPFQIVLLVMDVFLTKDRTASKIYGHFLKSNHS